MTCPGCGLTPSTVFRTAREIANEFAARTRFLPRGRDLTEVTLRTPADVLLCERCGILIRGETPDEEVFRDDRYDTAVLRTLHEMHAEAFQAKTGDYCRMLERGARVVEIGSYAGGFLRAASEWGWRVAGVDIGRDAARFTADLGFEMSSGFAPQRIDGLFVWNCFEQLADPHALLDAARGALPDGGVMVIRVLTRTSTSTAAISTSSPATACSGGHTVSGTAPPRCAGWPKSTGSCWRGSSAGRHCHHFRRGRRGGSK